LAWMARRAARQSSLPVSAALVVTVAGASLVASSPC
jgi:hypothetical protein